MVLVFVITIIKSMLHHLIGSMIFHIGSYFK